MRNCAIPFTVLLLSAPAVGQKDPAWTVDEATAAALLPLLARGDEVPSIGRNGARGRRDPSLADYRWARGQVPTSGGHGYVWYAWPLQNSVRTFAVTDRGVVMFTADRSRPYGVGECVPEWSAIVGKGSELKLSQALDMPGRGTDDQIWRPVLVSKAMTTRILVRGPDGTPVSGVSVALGALAWLGEAGTMPLGDEPFAVGLTCTDANGEAKVTSVAVKGVHVALAIGESLLEVPLHLERRHEGCIVVVEDPAAITLTTAARLNGNESAAIATLKNLSSAQAQMQACCASDANGNGAGEYAFFAQLSGGADVQAGAAPGGETRVHPPVMSGAFANVQGSCVQRSGYLFQIFLPCKDGWVTEAPFGGARGVPVDPTRAETMWCAYAWPLAAGRSGKRAFYVDMRGDVTSTRNVDGQYSGRDLRPAAGAAQVGNEAVPKQAANAQGNDGCTWIVIQ